MLCAFSSKFSRLSNSSTKSAAVFGPILGTPGTRKVKQSQHFQVLGFGGMRDVLLSDESPTNANTNPNLSGGTKNFSSTVFSSTLDTRLGLA